MPALTIAEAVILVETISSLIFTIWGLVLKKPWGWDPVTAIESLELALHDDALHKAITHCRGGHKLLDALEKYGGDAKKVASVLNTQYVDLKDMLYQTRVILKAREDHQRWVKEQDEWYKRHRGQD